MKSKDARQKIINWHAECNLGLHNESQSFEILDKILKSYARACVEDYQEELDNHLVANGWASIVGEFEKVDILTP